MAREERSVAENRKARHDYFIDEVFEAGLVLTGTEVKSLRLGRVNLRDSFARIIHGEAFLINCHIAPYEQGNRWNHDPYRDRKLLLHKKEIRELAQEVRQEGKTLIPLRIYFDKKGRAKVSLAVARGKKQYDKRQSIHERDAQRQIDRALKGRQR
ncbi:SsrA-binding protein [Sulfobacillus acidophilus TPY]|uniref:SsrA-binding protein n=1 Tax=Sulfobacillus acidophilus (strain ATCC 700253 / DSM 10332 / NAL) TaxID=679936 RepID=G8U127_SULAD|nr:SsrA-binding protein [Sulfobacillus acidophilus TPY]AEW04260.1 SsrA-binding protein [Sulfobacillus acidophilus DSM 10332]